MIKSGTFKLKSGKIKLTIPVVTTHNNSQLVHIANGLLTTWRDLPSPKWEGHGSKEERPLLPLQG